MDNDFLLLLQAKLEEASLKGIKGNLEQLKKEFGYIKSEWGKLHHLILLHGRYVCKAINPDCENCYLTKYCKHYNENKK